MANPFYERDGLNVAVYSARTVSKGNVAIEGDIAFYIALALEAGGEVLELGCGNGRVALPLARAGLPVTGVDLSKPMLDSARAALSLESPEVRQRLALHQADMRNFDLGREFACVIIAFRSFQMLLAPEDERACLATVRRHLELGGKLVIDIFDPRLDLLLPGEVGPPAIPRSEAVATALPSGNSVRVDVIRRTNDCVNQLLQETWRFTETASNGDAVRVEEEVLRMRWIYRWEMRYLLERQGFRVIAEYSSFDGSPPAYGNEQIWVAEAI